MTEVEIVERREDADIGLEERQVERSEGCLEDIVWENPEVGVEESEEKEI